MRAARFPGASAGAGALAVAAVAGALVGGACGSGGGSPRRDLGTLDGRAEDLLGADGAQSGPDLARADADAPPGDLATPAVADLSALPPLDLSVSDLRQITTGDLKQGSCAPRVNELVVGSTDALDEEMVELFNPCPAGVDLTGWRLVYRSRSNANPVDAQFDQALFTFPAQGLPAGAYLVLTGAAWKGLSDGKLVASLSADGGAVGLRDAGGALVDSVGYSTISIMGHALVEGAPAPKPPASPSPGGSIGRLPNGADTNNNAADFKVTAQVTPRAANK